MPLRIETQNIHPPDAFNEIRTSCSIILGDVVTKTLPHFRKNGISSAPSSPTKPRCKTFSPKPVKDISITLEDLKNTSIELKHASFWARDLIRRRSISDVVHHSDTSRLPTLSPGSPASSAIERANQKVAIGLMNKRVRIGRKKIGRTKYKREKTRLFNRPNGKEINPKHEQYALTYGMMSGILNSVGLQNQFKQHLVMDDFMRVEKRNFSASSKLRHPFKFKDYSPDIFRQIRRRFNIDSADYMLTLCGDFNYIEFISNSKSNQFFFYSHDGRFMIKTQTKAESKFLRRILPHYYKFAMENPNTLITRFYGMHRVKMHHLRQKMHFVIMNSVFDTPKPIHRKFDLKGSRVGRIASPKTKKINGVFKDMDLVNEGIHLGVGRAKRAMVLEQIRKDVAFLKRMKIMDYSLLLGIYDETETKNNSTKPDTNENAVGSLSDSEITKDASHIVSSFPPASRKRSISLPNYDQIPTESTPGEEDKISSSYSPHTELAIRLEEHSDEEASSDEDDFAILDPLSPRLLDTEKHPAHTESLFCHDEGGVYGRDLWGNRNGRIYFFGIIDILQQYNSRKIAETFLKGFRHNKKQISAVNPNFYGDRFIRFLEENVFVDDT